jgi:hypothetical protein
MTSDISEVPAWLLDELLLATGVFNETKTAVIGRPNPHLGAVLNTGGGVPSEVSFSLNEAQQRRIGVSEGGANG